MAKQFHAEHCTAKEAVDDSERFIRVLNPIDIKATWGVRFGPAKAANNIKITKPATEKETSLFKISLWLIFCSGF